MTMPDERYLSIDRTRRLLLNLINPEHTPRVPAIIRAEANFCLRHFPTTYDMMEAERLAPSLFQHEMEPLYRMVKQYDQDKS